MTHAQATRQCLVVIDMQNDFITGSLGTPEAVAIVPSVTRKMECFEGPIYLTQDSHGEDYLASQEGRLLPALHCQEGTSGWELVAPVEAIRRRKGLPVYLKNGFTSLDLVHELARAHAQEPFSSIEIIGLCTDICVVSNALALKAALPEVELRIDPACCAGTSPERHRAALATMQSCQIVGADACQKQ